MTNTEEKTEQATDKPTKQKKEKASKKALKNIAGSGANFFKDFKLFISKGNVIQLAVAFVMGAAFTAIVNSLVGDIFMPIFGLIFGETDITNWQWNNIHYGNFIWAVINFLLVAFMLFLIIKIVSGAGKGFRKIKKTETPPPPSAPELTTTEKLLTEIKELLKKQEEKK